MKFIAPICEERVCFLVLNSLKIQIRAHSIKNQPKNRLTFGKLLKKKKTVSTECFKAQKYQKISIADRNTLSII